jgi:aminodeoxyfutalosine synthase
MWQVSGKDKVLHSIYDKIHSGIRLDLEDGLALLDSGHMEGIKALACHVAGKRAGKEVYYIRNYHLYCSNVCIWKCKFCAFGKKRGNPGAYTKSIDEVINEISGLSEELTEIRITGGVNPVLDLNYYLAVIHFIKTHMPQVHIEALAPTEIDYLAQLENLEISEIVSRLKEAGLGSLSAGGAEIFNPDIRNRLCPRKTTGPEWINISRTAHLSGIPSNASILYGHIESYEDRISHLLAIRDLQDETGGFNSFIPLRFLPENTELSYLQAVGDAEALKMIAVCRLILDNFRHIKFLWIYHGIDMGMDALDFGANDLGGTVGEKERGVARSAGSIANSGVALSDFKSIIRAKGRIPVERGPLYSEKQRQVNGQST